MGMKLCPKCGCLSYFNSYFQKWMCNTCEHQFKGAEDGWCPNCEPDKFTPMTEGCSGCKGEPNKQKGGEE